MKPALSPGAEEVRRLVAELGEVPVKCPLCDTPAPDKLFHRDGKWFWICRGCEFVFVHDIYPEFVADTDYLDETGKLADATGIKPKQEKDYARLLAGFERFRSANRLLEVGCAAGIFLARATDQGWRCSGVEVLPTVAELARRNRGLDVRTGELADARFPDEEFDVVYMNEVIEHIVEPVEFMQEVRRVLRPGGVALLRTGNARSWSARLRGSRWHYYRFGGLLHIRFYSPKAARALARAAGFASVKTHTRGFAFLEAAEARGRWFKPFMQLAQSFISPLAAPCGTGHRLTMEFQTPTNPNA